MEAVIKDLPRILNSGFDNARDHRLAIESRLTTRLDSIEAKLDKSVDTFEAKFDMRLDTIGERLDSIEARLVIIEGKIDALPHVLARMLEGRERRRRGDRGDSNGSRPAPG